MKYNLADIHNAILLSGDDRRKRFRTLARLAVDEYTVEEINRIEEMVAKVVAPPVPLRIRPLITTLGWKALFLIALDNDLGLIQGSVSSLSFSLQRAARISTNAGRGLAWAVILDGLKDGGQAPATGVPSYLDAVFLDGELALMKEILVALGAWHLAPAMATAPTPPSSLSSASLGDLIKTIAPLASHIAKTSSPLNPWAEAADVMVQNGMPRSMLAPLTNALEAMRIANALPDITKPLDPSPEAQEIIDNMTTSSQPASAAVSTTEKTVAGISVSSNLTAAIDQLLMAASSSKLSLDYIAGREASLVNAAEAAEKKLSEQEAKVLDLEKRLAAASLSPVAKNVVIAATGKDPNGKAVSRKASDLFDVEDDYKKMLDFDVPYFEWDAPHPAVPAVDPDYQFQGKLLIPYLFSLIHNNPIFLTGHTATGKTTFSEQVQARLNWPTLRVSANRDMTMAQFVGKDALISDPVTNNTVSVFRDGVLPQAMTGGRVLLLDEADAMRPDCSFVFFPILETGRPLILADDGGRVVQPHPFFRCVATANTAWAGDESRVYHGTEQGNLALRNRFTGGFLTVDYLPEDREMAMVKKRVPLPDQLISTIVKFGRDVRNSFLTGDIMETCSPRDLFGMASAAARYMAVGFAQHDAVNEAIKLVLMNKASVADRNAIREIANRFVGSL